MKWEKLAANKRMAVKGITAMKKVKARGFIPALYGMNKWREHGLKGPKAGKLADYFAAREALGYEF